MARSRLNKTLLKQTERNVFFLIAGGIVVLVILFAFGIKLLTNLSMFVEKKSDTGATNSSQTTEYISTPTLDPLPDATNSATLNVSGVAEGSTKASLYLNGVKANDADVKDDGTFLFRNVTLESGDNTIKVQTQDSSGKQSKFSDTATVTYSNKAPDLTVDFPSDGQTYHKDDNPLKVRGKTSPNTKVTVNDFWAIVDDQGNYSYSLPLQNGDNQIKVVAVDDAGNKTEKDLKVSYSE